ncbi:MAG: hypothetical protein KJP04_08245 [Arenicella sp.]|nr:hypothetical protein [Arenicella sp.]
MSPENLLPIAIFVFVLMFLGMLLTVLEFRRGEPKEQVEDPSKIRESPHGHVDD